MGAIVTGATIPNGAFYKAVPLQGGGWRIDVLVRVNGAFVERDMNTTPWPNEPVAKSRARAAAEIAAAFYQVPVVEVAHG